jgi:hypothetical protein
LPDPSLSLALSFFQLPDPPPFAALSFLLFWSNSTTSMFNVQTCVQLGARIDFFFFGKKTHKTIIGSKPQQVVSNSHISKLTMSSASTNIAEVTDVRGSRLKATDY